MTFPLHLLYPLASSFAYVAAVLLLKRSAAFGVGLWRSTFIANAVTAVCFVPLWTLGGELPPWSEWWQPAFTAALFLVGQVATFLAIRGDVSVATPVLGLKIILVALFSTLLLASPVPVQWWIAAVLSTLAITLLGRGRGGSGRAAGRTAVLAGVAATAFALSDVLLQKWAPAWGPGRFLPLMFWLVQGYSFALVPLFREPLRTIPAAGWRWLLPGCLLLALQAVGIGYVLAAHGDATAVNIVYSVRGLWSVLAVWLVGHWFRNEEQHLGGRVLRRRLAGAVLMLVAIVLVLRR